MLVTSYLGKARSAPRVPGMSAKTAHQPLELRLSCSQASWTSSAAENPPTDNSRDAIVVEGQFWASGGSQKDQNPSCVEPS